MKQLSGLVFKLREDTVAYAEVKNELINFAVDNPIELGFQASRRNNPNTGWSSPEPGALFIIVGYSMLLLGFSKWILIVFVLDPDTLTTKEA